MKKTILVIAIILCIAKLNAQGNIQIITPIISHCLIHISPDKAANTTGLNLKVQTPFQENKNKWALYASLAYASDTKFNFDYTGLKLATGLVFKINEQENYYMSIAVAPQFVFTPAYYPYLKYLGYEIDFQTKFNPNKRISPIVGIYSATNFSPQKKDKDSENSFSYYDESKSYNKSNPNFYLDIGIQIYLGIAINFN